MTGGGGHFRGYLPTSFYQISEFYKIFRKTVDIFSNSEKFGKILTKIHLIRSEKQQILLQKKEICNFFTKKSEKNYPKFADFLDWSGAKVCKSCRSRKTLQNEYFLAKIGLDTADIEPSKICRYLPTTPPTVIYTALKIYRDSRSQRLRLLCC